MHPENVDQFLLIGCGRCSLGGTPDCKVHRWAEELKLFRQILLECGLQEEIKWSIPCYTYQGKNIVLISAFKEYVALSFFKGSLLQDPDQLLVAQTENVQATRQIRIQNSQDILAIEASIKAYLFEAIEIEKAGLKVTRKETADFDVPEELQNIFERDPEFQDAFQALTPGRQRGYLLHFAQAKQSKTRVARIEKYRPLILEGKGMHDDYRC
ncbi:MAG: hypothetical protein EP338_01600 [Bacteroidetes bacterium]|nr:MAG: hypothetical protein EP338_01600 [Bacteroidota bacterium]